MFYVSEHHGLVMVENGVVSFVPTAEANVEYQKYLAWVTEGNTAEPWNDTPTEITPPPGG